jgi:hypothetical protein
MNVCVFHTQSATHHHYAAFGRLGGVQRAVAALGRVLEGFVALAGEPHMVALLSAHAEIRIHLLKHHTTSYSTHERLRIRKPSIHTRVPSRALSIRG